MSVARLSRLFLGALFALAGLNHFAAPELYRRIMPPYLPAHDLLISLSGVLEIVLGLLLVLPRTRHVAGTGLVLLLIAVFPANLHMALNAAEFPQLPEWSLWARLPLQAVLIMWVLHASRGD